MAEIILAGLGKSYSGGVMAVSDIDLTIADGEFIVLVGPSGCGKSTLLRMVAGLEEITEGTVSIGGRVVNRLDPSARDIAMVFQNYALYPHMTVRENMAYGLRNRATPAPEIAARIAEAARMLELGPYLDRKPRALSGGQRQRVAMGRAVVRQPAAFLFDEPLSNLDARLRVSMRSEIRKLQKRLATTALYVTHDQLEAMTLADRLVVLNAGRIEQIGTPLQVYHAPASTFVASFIGAPAMSLLDARLEGGWLRLGGQALAARSQLAGGGAQRLADGPLTLGLRAEDLQPLPPGAAPGQTLALRIDHIEELGAQRIIHAMIDGQPLAMLLSPDHPLPGDGLIRVRARKLHLFDTMTGRRLAEPLVLDPARQQA